MRYSGRSRYATGTKRVPSRLKQLRKKIRKKKKVFDYQFKRETRARANEKIQVFKLTEEI